MGEMFRKLHADEIECRVSMIRENGVQLLLYKDARCDMNLLDETVGQMNWKREHALIDGNLYCIVSLFDTEKGQWVSKQDVGVESYTEKEKGQASDSFKRACTNWGIGRELYTAPFIWIPNNKCDIDNKQGKLRCNTDFTVTGIEYDARGRISFLQIIGCDRKTGDLRVVFSKGKQSLNDSENTAEKSADKPVKATKSEAPAPTNVPAPPVILASAAGKQQFIDKCAEMGFDYKQIAKEVGVTGRMTADQLKAAWARFDELEKIVSSTEPLVNPIGK